jgi:hypothetical protein
VKRDKLEPSYSEPCARYLVPNPEQKCIRNGLARVGSGRVSAVNPRLLSLRSHQQQSSLNEREMALFSELSCSPSAKSTPSATTPRASPTGDSTRPMDAKRIGD